MSRLSALALAVLIAAAPLSAASAQSRGPLEPQGERLVGLGLLAGAPFQDRGPRGGRDRDEGERPRLMSEAQAQSIAQSRAGGARFVGSLGLRGTTYVFRFERDGRIIDIAVDARG